MGLEYRRKGSGAVLHGDGHVIKASNLERAASFGAMQKRLGAYVDPPSGARRSPDSPSPARRTTPQPLRASSAEWKSYTEERTQHYARKDAELLELRRRHDNERKALRDEQRVRRTDVLDATKNRTARQAMRSVMAAENAGERATLRDRQQQEREAFRAAHPRFADLEQWLRERDPAAAARWRYRSTEPGLIEGPQFVAPRPADIRDFAASIHGAEVHYHRRQLDAPTSFIDRGRAILVQETHDDAAVLASLQLAAQKWGRLHIQGSESYKALCTRLAVTHGFQLDNPELQDPLHALRAAQRGGRSHPGSPRVPMSRPSDSLDARPSVARVGSHPPPECRNQLRSITELLPEPRTIQAATARADASPMRAGPAPMVDHRAPVPRIGSHPPPESRNQARSITDLFEPKGDALHPRAKGPSNEVTKRVGEGMADTASRPQRHTPHVLEQFERYHAAVGADRYRVTAIRMKDDGTRQAFVLDKRNGETVGFTPQELRARMREMVRLEQRGENIYFTPLSEKRHHILVDDMTKTRLDKFLAEGHAPAVVLESSPGNFQAIVNVPKFGSPHDRQVGNRLSRELNAVYGDPNLSGAVHPHRAPGFSNRKPERRRDDGSYPTVQLVHAAAGDSPLDLRAAQAILDEQVVALARRPTPTTAAPQGPLPPPTTTAATAYQEHYRDLGARFGDTVNLSRVDSMIALRLRATGHDQAAVAAAIEQSAPGIRPPERQDSHDWRDYAQRTAAYAFGPGGDHQLDRTRRYHEQWRRLESQPVAVRTASTPELGAERGSPRPEAPDIEVP